MTAPAAGVSIPRRRGRRPRVRLVVGVLLAALLAGTLIAWLQTTGTTAFTIPPASGTADDGTVVNVVAMSTEVTRTNGAALLQVGVGLAKLEVAKDFADSLRVTIAGTNLHEADQVSNNPNSRFSIGLYHPIHTGACSDTDNSIDAPRVNVVDPDTSGTLCAVLAPSPDQATGPAVSDAGKLLLAKNFQASYLRPRLAAPASPGTCGSTIPGGTSDVNDPWCQPAGTDAEQRVLYLVASIVTPGGIPQGQQSNLNQLTFYVVGRLETAGS